MTPEAQLNTLLTAHAPLVALVGTRIHPDALPEKTQYPALTYSRGDTTAVPTIHGAGDAEFVKFEISVWAKTRTAADQAADAVKGALQAAGEMLDSRASGYDEQLGLYGAVLETTLFDPGD